MPEPSARRLLFSRGVDLSRDRGKAMELLLQAGELACAESYNNMVFMTTVNNVSPF